LRGSKHFGRICNHHLPLFYPGGGGRSSRLLWNVGIYLEDSNLCNLHTHSRENVKSKTRSLEVP
jgi:hypothetical protein